MPGGAQSVCGRRRAERSAFRLRVVAIRYSRVRTEARPSKLPRPCQADSQQGFLEDVPGVTGGTEDPAAVYFKLMPARLDKLTERVSIPGLGFPGRRGCGVTPRILIRLLVCSITANTRSRAPDKVTAPPASRVRVRLASVGLGGGREQRPGRITIPWASAEVTSGAEAVHGTGTQAA
jgi:hypothetical protein